MELSKVLHLYIGCKFKHVIDDIDYTLTGISYDRLFFDNDSTSLRLDWLKESSVKPILRRLESITEEEARKVYEAGKEDFGTMDGDVSSYYANFPAFFNQHEYLKLLEMSFDLFGLIDSGQAIEKKEVPA